MELTLTVENSRAKQFINFLKTLEYVEVKKRAKEKTDNTPYFAYFGACIDWEADAKELRAQSSRKKAQW